MMKKSVNLYFNAKFDTAEKLRTIKAVGYEEWYTGIHDVVEQMTWPEQIAMARSLGLEITMMHCEYGANKLDEFWLPGPKGDAIVAYYTRQIQACGPYHVKNFVVHLHTYYGSRTSEIGLQRLQKLLKACEPYQMNLCVENLYSETEIPYIFANLQHPLLKICYDSGHRHCFTPNFELVHNYHQYITVLHLHENDGSDDQHQILTPGSPVFQRLVKEVPLLNDDVTLAAEIKIPDGECAAILRRNLDALTALDRQAHAKN